MNEVESWRKAFEKIGPDTLRLQLVDRRVELSDPYRRCAESWLLEQDAKADRIETARFETIRRWTITSVVVGTIAAVAGVIAAIAAVIAAWFTVWPPGH
jgi:hypothetical protein